MTGVVRAVSEVAWMVDDEQGVVYVAPLPEGPVAILPDPAGYIWQVVHDAAGPCPVGMVTAAVRDASGLGEEEAAALVEAVLSQLDDLDLVVKS